MHPIPDVERIPVPDDEWVALCKDKDANPWYAVIPALYPRGFYKKSEKTMYVKKSAMGNDDLQCHELGHALEHQFGLAYTHPKNMIDALKHAIKARDTMAFSGVFRWSRKPDELWETYWVWKETLKY